MIALWNSTLTEDIHNEFLLRTGCIDLSPAARMAQGFSLWDPVARAELERGRRAYKAYKMRQSYQSTGRPRGPVKAGRLASCHAERQHYAHDMCRSCYYGQKRKVEK